MNLNEILKVAVKNKASDVHLKVGLPPVLRVNGRLVPLKMDYRLKQEDLMGITNMVLSDAQKERFREMRELDVAYSVSGLGRFRANIFMQRGTLGVALRVVPGGVLSFEELNLPEILEKVASESRGLILCTGTTGSGKSTTLASIIEYINNHRTCHIITIEDPIEFLLKDKKSIITQREVEVDTPNFAAALKSALRQDPDVILVGEMRDYETIETALVAAETGHLVLSTLHTLDAAETINRIITVFPPYQQKQIRLQLSSILKSIISQRLVMRTDGEGRVPAVEILLNTARIREYIEDKEKTKKIRDAIAEGFTTYGMQTFDQSLMNLYRKDLVTLDEAMRQATNPEDFALRVKGVTSSSDLTWDEFDRVDGDDDSS
ncbi:MAG: PilT/PilU family type 4a pilus ATPase [Deltaproteobacteria bacterium]|nr:PilT/PilU family type 4a pilus ATPase [Deltaproteobacteria bacterium]NIS77507.1 PilT/PilU family type 4a pilus ATPase [Deltaproteobacteria bacterium]